MFIISEKFDKEVRRNYATLVEEKSDTMPEETTNAGDMAENRSNKRTCRCSTLVFILCFIITSFLLHYILMLRITVSDRAEIFVDSSEQAYQLATMAIKDSQAAVRAITQKTLSLPAKNKAEAADYLNKVQDTLKKRVKYSVDRISQIIRDGVRDIENELALFERSLSTLLNGVIDVTRHSIVDMKTNIEKVSPVEDASQFQKTIEQVHGEIAQLLRNFDDMFTYQGKHLNDVVHDKVQKITDQIRTILVVDSKYFPKVVGLQVAFCYNISRQNYDISKDLEKILISVDKLRKTADAVNVTSSVFAAVGENPLILKAKHVLSVEINNTKEIFSTIMNTDENFLSTTLKRMAYQKHLEMKHIVYENYETAMRSILPAVREATQEFEIVKNSHWERVKEVVYPELTDLTILLQRKAALIANNVNGKNTIVRDSEFKTIYPLMRTRFQEIATKVNAFFREKQDYEGFELMLVVTMDEKLPLISTWSLQNYVPSDACPMTVEFQTYLKGIMDGYLSRSDDHSVAVPSLQLTFEK